MSSCNDRVIRGRLHRVAMLLGAAGMMSATGALPVWAQLSDQEARVLPPCGAPVDKSKGAGTCIGEDGQRRVWWIEDRLSPVEVWGDRSRADPGSQAFVTAEQIDATAADHPAEILNQLPGVNVQMNSGQEHLIAIRSPVLTGGAGQGSFLILENGVPTRSPAFGNVNSLIEPHHEIADASRSCAGRAARNTARTLCTD